MGKKIFVSYKYADDNVAFLEEYNHFGLYSTARNYVDYLQDRNFSGDDLNKAENDNEDLSKFKDTTIKSKLRDKIWDSSITLVLISPNMQDILKKEEDQWIPWEVSYSLRTERRNGKNSLPNGMIAVILPDKSGSYSYFTYHHNLVDDDGKTHNVRVINTDNTFEIIGNNMFNQKEPDYDIMQGQKVYHGECSYIIAVSWEDFIKDTDTYINRATDLKENSIDEYDLQKKLK